MENHRVMYFLCVAQVKWPDMFLKVKSKEKFLVTLDSASCSIIIITILLNLNTFLIKAK